MVLFPKLILTIYALSIGFVSLASANEALFEEALKEANAGNTASAIQKLESLKSQMPNDGRLRQSLGLLYQSTDQYDKAISELNAAYGLQPTAETCYALGLLYEAKGSNQEAKTYWKRFLELAGASDPRSSTARRHLESLNE